MTQKAGHLLERLAVAGLAVLTAMTAVLCIVLD